MLSDLIREQTMLAKESQEAREAIYKAHLKKLALVLAEGIKRLPEDIEQGELVAVGIPDIKYVYRQLHHPDLSEFYIYTYSDRDPAAIAIGRNWHQGQITHFENEVSTDNENEVAKFLYQRYHEKEKTKEQNRKHSIQICLATLGAVKRFHSTMTGHWTELAKLPETAQDAFNDLVRLDPEHKEEWESALAAWQEQYDNDQTYLKREQEEKQLAKEATEKYKADFKAWLTKALEVRERNLKTLADLQRTLDVSYQVVTIERGVVGKDDEGYPKTWVDNVEVRVLPDGLLVDDDSYYHVIKKGGRVSWWRIPKHCIIGISEPRQLKATDGEGRLKRVPREYFNPWVSLDFPETLYSAPGKEIDLDGVFEEFPPMPEGRRDVRNEVVSDFDFGDID